MIVHKNIEQGSPEWHELRYGKIGGSSLKELMTNEGKPVRNNAVYNEILAAQFEPYVHEESYISKEMDRGNRLEPMARLAYEDMFGVEVIQIGFAELNSFAGVSPDGLIGSSEALEIKCPSANTHVKYMLNPMSMIEYYVWQCVMYFVVFDDLEVLNFISYRPENSVCPLVLQVVTKDTEILVSAKKTAKISVLVEEAKARIAELEESIKIDKNNFLNF